MSVDQMLETLLGKEGGYTDHPSDRGGPTNWGITEKVARAYGYAGDMRDLDRSRARSIYRARYWQDPGFSSVAGHSIKVAEELFDTGVNMGPAVASKFLQRALNTLNRRGKDWPDIEVDGRIGRITLTCLDEFLKRRGADGEKTLLAMLNAQQSVRYMEISEANPSQEDFAFGWQFNRVAS